MELEIFNDGSFIVVAWNAKGVFVKFDRREEAHKFAREMISTFTGVDV